MTVFPEVREAPPSFSRGDGTLPGALRPSEDDRHPDAATAAAQGRILGLDLHAQQTIIQRAKLVKEYVRRSPWIPHDPSPKQSIFLALDHLEAMYGGAAGGGKSDALLMAAVMYADLHPAYSALMLRRNYGDLSLPGALMDRAFSWWGGTAAKWRAGRMRWVFPNGSSVSFGHLQNSVDRFRYASSEFQTICWDELTQFIETDYLFLFSRLRRTQEIPVPLRVRSASNPGGRGHEWVRARFIKQDMDTLRTRAFVPAVLKDNPFINYDEYVAALGELDPVTLRQLLFGDWDAVSAGNMFRRSTFETIEIEQLPTIRHWLRFWDCAASEETEGNKNPDWTAGVLLGQDYQDKVYVVDVVRGRWGPKDVENMVITTAHEDGHEVSVRMEQEGGSSGKMVIDTFARKLAGYDFIGIPSSGSKEVRARPLAAAAGRGDVFLVDNGRRFQSWYNSFMIELESFPSPGFHDDQVDAASGAYSSLSFRTDVGSDLAARNRALGMPRAIPTPTGRGLKLKVPF